MASWRQANNQFNRNFGINLHTPELTFDVQWYVAHQERYTVVNKFRNGPNPEDITEVTSIKPRSDQYIGEFVCKYGATTGFGCGEIVRRYVKVDWIPNAQPTFIMLRNSRVAIARPGDSGGPVFLGHVAYGIISGYVDDDLMYMAIDYVERGLGIQILTTP